MNLNFCCPKCGSIVNEKDIDFECKKCIRIFPKKKNLYDFSYNENIPKKKQNSKIEILMRNINENYYEKGINEFIKKFPKEKSYLVNTKFDQSVDGVFHCLNNKYKNCLVIGGDYGNASEVLSQIFEKVFSLQHSEECIEFHQRRFKENNIKNVISIKINLEDLPFNENSFDVILFYNNFLNKEFSKYESDITKSKYLQKIKNMLTDGGCLCLSMKNKYGSSFFSDKNESSKSHEKKFSLSECVNIWKKIDFKVKLYWGLPSEERPYFSAKIDDEIASKWYFSNFGSFVKGSKIKTKHKISYYILRNLPGFIQKYLIHNFSPFFTFCCYKNQISETIEDLIIKKIKFEHCLIISRRIKIIFIFFNDSGKPKFIVNLKRYGKKIPQDILLHKREFPKMNNPDQRLWMEEWKDGRTLNPFKHEELIAAIDWLVDFQKNTSQGNLNNDDLFEEIQIIRDGIKKLKPLDKDQYRKWLDEYELLFQKNEIKKTAVHGDFWYANMLYNSKQKLINLVNWENYKVTGTPFHDLSTFIMRWMMMSDTNQVEAFKFNLINNKKFKAILNQVQKIVNAHFNFNIDFNILLRYLILRNIVKAANKQSEAYYKYSEMLKILEKYSF